MPMPSLCEHLFSLRKASEINPMHTKITPSEIIHSTEIIALLGAGCMYYDSTVQPTPTKISNSIEINMMLIFLL